MDMNNKIHIDYNQLENYTRELIEQINSSNFKPDYVVSVTENGILPAVLISKYFNVPVHNLKVTLINGKEDDCEHNAWMSEDAFGYPYEKNRLNILIVTSINDSGDIIKWIKNDWQGSVNPANNDWKTVWHNNVKFAAIVNNTSSTEPVDYAGITFNSNENPTDVIFPTDNWWKR